MSNLSVKLPFLSNRDPKSAKWDYGHVLLVAGSYGKMGAAVLAAKACLRSGVGLVTVHVPRRGVDIIQTALPEAMASIDDDDCRFTTLPANLDRYDALAVGPAIGTDEQTCRALFALLETIPPSMPRVLDADALNILASHPQALHLASGAVISPHVNEYRRLFGDAEPQSMAEMHNLVIVKKGHISCVYAPSVSPMKIDKGNPGMATAGCGDVLTGVVAGILAQYQAYSKQHSMDAVSVQQLAATAVEVHALAGTKAAQYKSQASMIASDIVEQLMVP